MMITCRSVLLRSPRAIALSLGLLALVVFTSPALEQVSAQQAKTASQAGANYKLAYKYSPDFLRQFVYSMSVTPHWIGKSDSFWYEYKTSKGKQWYRVNPRDAGKEPLFDRVKLGALLSEDVRKPLDPLQLPLTAVSLDDDGGKLKFSAEGYRFEYELKTDKLVRAGKAAAPAFGGGFGDAEKLQKLKEKLTEEEFRELMEKKLLEKKEEDKQDQEKQDDKQEKDIMGKKGGMGGGFGGGFGGDYRNFSPDKKLYAFVMNYDLYLAEAGKEKEAVQLTKDGGADYTFSAFGGGFGGKGDTQKDQDKNKDRKTRAPVTWAKDSKAFYVQRSDSRGVKELFLVNSVSNPRPTLSQYKYAMPGEDKVRKSELFVYLVEKKKLTQIERKWKDESYSDLAWGKTSDELRFLRRDRLIRNQELCSFNPQSGESKCLILEGFENSMITAQPAKYLEDTNEMLWWSEKSGWGHFYLHERGGKFKNAVTAGDFRASRIVELDTKNRTLYFEANGREPGENVYFNHLYCVRLDGTNLTLLDPGNANHQSVLSPTKQFIVDNCSRTDMAPMSILRDARGNKIMELEHADLSRLFEFGWKMPETFVVKAADGVTDLFGNMWKPFDFDPSKRYPVIAHVYPGPQTESMQHSFGAATPTSGQQQLAQLGFIVIQVGNRGGTPLRSKAYQSHSYWNMRDYGLADKKSAIEQLAARYSWIDIDRIGIYGHSGGGFMSAAALLVKPYNEFFKVAVSSAGNHDNNVYNNSWAERYHGMKEITAKEAEAKKAETAPPPTKFGGKGKKQAPFSGEPQATSQTEDSTPQDKGEKKDEKKTKDADTKKTEVIAPPTKDGKKDDAKTKDDKKVKEEKKADDKKEQMKDDKSLKDEVKAKEEMRWDIKVPTNPELAANLKGKLLLVHGDMDNNVHPANTIRLVDALIKANKRFDMLILPGKAHGFADFQPYFTQRMWEYFAEHLLDDRSSGTDIFERKK